ncbi:MAG: hypothetical protein R3D26_12920 [Cyanobacteriota/Melainabacteria group bacterium]
MNADGAGFLPGTVFRAGSIAICAPYYWSRLSNIERLNLITDLFMSILAERTEPEEYLEMLDAYKEESEPQIWIFIASTCYTPGS